MQKNCLEKLFPTLLGIILIWVGACSNSHPDVAPGGKTIGDEDDDDDYTFIDEKPSDSFKGCGFESFADSSAKFNQNIKSANMRFHGNGDDIFSTEYNVIVKGHLDFSGDLRKFNARSDFEIISADPQKAYGEAQEKIAEVTGTREATVVDENDWEDLVEGDWDGIYCTILPAAGLVEQTSRHRTEIEFSPPLPYFIFPFASRSRFEFELPKSRTFPRITARVVSTTNPKLSGVTSREGTITYSPANPSSSFTDSNGNTVEVKADYAYRVEFDFGNNELTQALGLYRTTTYYIDNGRFIAISIETGIQDAPIVDYLEGE